MQLHMKVLMYGGRLYKTLNYILTFTLTVVNFNYVFIQPAVLNGNNTNTISRNCLEVRKFNQQKSLVYNINYLSTESEVFKVHYYMAEINAAR